MSRNDNEKNFYFDTLCYKLKLKFRTPSFVQRECQ